MVVIMMDLRKLDALKISLVDRILDGETPVDLGEIKAVKRFSDLDKDSKYDWRYDVNGKTLYSRNFNTRETSHFLMFNQDILYNGTVYIAPADDTRRVA